jgi:hypothetical protein
MRKNLNQISEAVVLVFILVVWVHSLYKVVSRVKFPRVFNAGAVSVDCLLPPCPPPEPPTPPCPPPCPPECPTPTPTTYLPTLTPTPPLEEPTSTPTPTLPGEPSPTPTSPPAEGEGGVGGPPGGGGPPSCGAQIPAAPYLRSVTKTKSDEAELIWDPVEPVTHYSLSYGPSSGNYLYGVPNTGKTTSFRVGALGSGNYCFIVRAVNDCAPSGPSNELCTGGVAPQVLGAKVLGATGSALDELLAILVIMGSVCVGLGLRSYLPSVKEA